MLVTTFPQETDYPAERRLRGLVRPLAHRARVLSGPLRAAECRRTRAGDGPGRARTSRLLATFDSGLHLPRCGTTAPPTTASSTSRSRRATPRFARVPRRPGRDPEVGAAAPTPGRASLGPARGLPPIVWNGRLSPGAQRQFAVGLHTLGNSVRVWRSGVGIDRRGRLDLLQLRTAKTVTTLAQVLQRPGAVQRDGVRHQPRVAHA